MVLLLHKKPVGSTFKERATRGVRLVHTDGNSRCKLQFYPNYPLEPRQEGALTYHSDKSIPGCSKFFPAWAAGALVVKGSTVRIG